MTEKNKNKYNGQPDKKNALQSTAQQAENSDKSGAETPRSYKSGSSLPLDIVEKMFVAYQKKQTASSVAKSVGVSEKTALRYMNKGDSSRGILSFKARTASRHRKQDARAAVSLGKAEEAMLEATIGTLSVVRYALVNLTKKIQAKEDIEIDPHRIPSMLKDLNSIIMYAKGDPDKKKEVEDKYASWSLAELTEYYLNGVKPDHAKNDPNGPRFEKPKNLN